MRPVAIALLLLLGAACSDDEPSATEQACDTWRELLTENPAPSDEDVAAELRAVDLDDVDQDVAGAVTAVAARLESGDDISAAYEELSDLCA